MRESPFRRTRCLLRRSFVVLVSCGAFTLLAGRALADETGSAEAVPVESHLPPPVVRRVDTLEKELRELREVVRRQAEQIQEWNRRVGVVPIRPAPAPSSSAVGAPSAAPAAPPCPPPAPCIDRREFKAPCPAPAPVVRDDPCRCPEDLGPSDPALVAGYDGQFYVRSRSGRFRASFGIYTQARWTWNRREASPPGEEMNTADWEMVRTRIFAEADFTKYFYTHFRFNVDGSGSTSLIVSYLQVKPFEGFHVRVGRQFIALTREDWIYPQDLLTADFSANDTIFGIGTSNGIQARKTWAHDRVWFTLSDGAFGGGQSFGDQAQAEYAVSGRYEHQFLTDDWSVWGDLVGRRGRPRGLLLGVAGGYQRGGNQTPTRWGSMATVDLSYNWDGGQALVYGSWIRADSRTAGHVSHYGFVAQGGHFVTGMLQVYGRYEFVGAEGYGREVDDYQSVLAGLNVYPFQWTNRYKVTAEAGYLLSALSETIVPAGTNTGFLPVDEGGQFFLRFQLQFGF